MTIDPGSQELQAVLTGLETFFEAERQQRKIPGLSVAIIHDQQLLWSRGFGFADIEKQLPATSQTIYCVASITKIFTATMLMQLRDAGKVYLDEPIQQYLPELNVRSPFADTSPITFRQVVSHLSGLPRDIVIRAPSQEETQIISSAMLPTLDIEMIAPPFAKKHYSNLGFALLNLALERNAEQSFAEYVTEHILRPLKMNSSGFEPLKKMPEYLQTHLATPYLLSSEKDVPVAQRLESYPPDDLFSSVEDIALFLSSQLYDGAADENHMLKGSTLREMQSPVFLDPDWNRAIAIGWELGRTQSYTTVRKGGSAAGFSTEILLVPALKLGLALFLNTNETKSELNSSALSMLLPVFSQLSQRMRDALPPPQLECKLYEGYYAGNVGAFDVRLMPNMLVALIGETEVPLFPAGTHRFRMQSGPFEGEHLHFVIDEEGRATQALSSGHLFERDEKKI